VLQTDAAAHAEAPSEGGAELTCTAVSEGRPDGLPGAFSSTKLTGYHRQLSTTSRAFDWLLAKLEEVTVTTTRLDLCCT
jgi:hypothetical protein